MNTNEIMKSEEVIETTEQVVTAGSGRGIKVVAGVGLAVLTGVLVYKYVAKPIVAKIKAQKEQEQFIDDAEFVEIADVAEEDEGLEDN